MPRFSFRLDPLIRVRRQVEQARQIAVAALERQRLDLEDSLRKQQQFITEGKQTLRDRLVGPVDITGLRTHAGSTIQLMRRANQIVLELAGVHRRLESARNELIQATKDRRAIELLRERRFEQWKTNLNRAEDAAIDELAVQAAGRKEQ